MPAAGEGARRHAGARVGGRCLPRRSDRRRRAQRLTERTLPRAGGRRAGGAPATVTGTNKEVLCARAACAPPRPPPPPPRPRLRPAPRCLPGRVPTRAPGWGPARLAGLRKLASRHRPRSGYFSELVTPAFCEKTDQKKLCAFFFSPEWVQEARPGEPPPSARAAGRANWAPEQGRPQGPGCKRRARLAPALGPHAGRSSTWKVQFA